MGWSVGGLQESEKRMRVVEILRLSGRYVYVTTTEKIGLEISTSALGHEG